MSRPLPFYKKIDILSKLLEGKPPKQVAYEAKVGRTFVSAIKEDFPLFLGLKRKYKKGDSK